MVIIKQLADYVSDRQMQMMTAALLLKRPGIKDWIGFHDMFRSLAMLCCTLKWKEILAEATGVPRLIKPGQELFERIHEWVKHALDTGADQVGCETVHHKVKPKLVCKEKQ